MGADAEVFIFDYQAYNNEVVPAFRELLLNGQMPEWLGRLIEVREMQPERWRGTDLLRYCTYLEKDFSWIGSYDDRDYYHGSKEIPTGTCHAILKAAGIKDQS